MTETDRPLCVYLLSGGSGHTAEQVVRAASAQFQGRRIRPVLRPRVQSAEAAVATVEEAARAGAILCHSLVDPEVRAAALRSAETHNLPHIDVLGPALSVLEDALGVPPLGQPGLSYELNKEQFDRMDAVDFTLAHDDGQRSEELASAEVVLVGVSRVSKSVTCFYLAYRGVRAANVPIVEGIPLPDALTRINPQKVIGLSMNPHRLSLLRQVRRDKVGAPLDSYVNERSVQAELRAAGQLMNEHGWISIDVSYRAVEEVAVDILHLIRPIHGKNA